MFFYLIYIIILLIVNTLGVEALNFDLGFTYMHEILHCTRATLYSPVITVRFYLYSICMFVRITIGGGDR